MATTTDLTEKYISEHPSIKDCIKYDIINYSKLARKIAKELGIEKQSSIEAILVAARRYAEKIRIKDNLEKKIMDILRRSELEIRNKIIVAIVDKNVYIEQLIDLEKEVRQKADIFYTMEGTGVFTIITTEKNLEKLIKLFGKHIVRLKRDLAMIIVKSPEAVEETPGVLAYLYSIFGEHGINIVETMSCWTDTFFVISEKDVIKILKFFKF